MWLLALVAACRALGVRSEDAPWVDRLDHGSFRGFPTLAEAGALLEGWLSEYPGLLRKERIGESFEHRPIDAYVLAARPRAAAGPEGSAGGGAARAQLLITALMHSREPATLTCVLYAMGHLMELYQGGDPEAVYLLEGRELWSVPFVNPDGYAANEKLGIHGMIRKNRRPTCQRSQSSGVDINRNFGVAWKKDAFPKCDEEYGGTAPFSEPETQAYKKVCEDNSFKAVMNFHSFGSMLTHPWNYAPTKAKAKLPDPDHDAIYRELQDVFKFDLFGAAINTVGYTAIGESDDWIYSARGAIAMSPEVGPESGGFYPDRKLIRGIDSLNFHRAVHLLIKVGLELTAEWDAGDAAGTLRLRLNNSGLSPSAGAALRVAVAGPAAGAPAPGAAGGSAGVRPAAGGAALPAWREGTAVVFEAPPLPRRSSAAYLVSIGQGGVEVAGLRLCAVEAGASRACHCHGPAGGGPGSRAAAATRRALPGAGAGEDAELCGAAQGLQPAYAAQPAAVAASPPPGPESWPPPAAVARKPALPPPKSMKKAHGTEPGMIVGALVLAGAGVWLLLCVSCRGRARMQAGAANDDETEPSLSPKEGPVRTFGRTSPV